MNLNSCPDSVQVLAWIGGIVVFVIAYGLVAYFARMIALAYYGKNYSELTRKEKENVNMITWLWPGVPAFFALWWLYEAVLLPFTAARKRDLLRVKRELSAKIDERCPVAPSQTVRTKFKVNDLITGIRGNPDNYRRLNEGCVCRVLSIDEKERMKVVLVDHKNFEQHSSVTGKVFKAPARNFVKYANRPTKISKKKRR